MWVFSKLGFFSVVQDRNDKYTVIVRARVAADLDNLRNEYLDDLGPTIEGAGTDYRYRAYVSKDLFANALQNIAIDIDYGNFKDEVQRVQGPVRCNAYHKVWDVMRMFADGRRRG